MSYETYCIVAYWRYESFRKIIDKTVPSMRIVCQEEYNLTMVFHRVALDKNGGPKSKVIGYVVVELMNQGMHKLIN